MDTRALTRELALATVIGVAKYLANYSTKVEGL